MSSSTSQAKAPCTLRPPVVNTADGAVVREWLLTNDAGDLACGTVGGPNTRRRHGLFTVAEEAGRPAMLLLSALDMALEKGEESYPLSCHQFADSRHPEGFSRCEEFRALPSPRWRYEVPGAEIAFRILMPEAERRVVCVWRVSTEETGWRLSVRPLFAYREAEALTHANDAADMELRKQEGTWRIAPYVGCPELIIRADGAAFERDPCWYYRLEHAWDVCVGRDGIEDAFSPGVLRWELPAKGSVALAAGLNDGPTDIEVIEADQARRLADWVVPAPDDDISVALTESARAFLQSGADGRFVLVPALPDSGGDARAVLIALPGILLCTRRLDAARDILRGMLERIEEDASDRPLDDLPLWLIRAGELYVDHSRDWGFLREELAPAAGRLVQRYLDNAPERGFHMSADGLLMNNDRGLALTWMNALIEGWPATARVGKPVEVNALWHHALSLLARWSRRRGLAEEERRYARMRDLCRRSFRNRFANRSISGLFDVVDAPDRDIPDAAIRPNQIFAVSLPSDLLGRAEADGVLRIVENRLLTPVGLRTLSLEDRAFRPRYDGGEMERAAARHQGSVYPWLLGPYADAVFRVRGRTSNAYARVEASLKYLLEEHLSEGCVGHVSELFHGAGPHAPRGAPAHAPALGELIRVVSEIRGRLW